MPYHYDDCGEFLYLKATRYGAHCELKVHRCVFLYIFTGIIAIFISHLLLVVIESIHSWIDINCYKVMSIIEDVHATANQA